MLVLCDLLNKRPGAKKVGEFLAKNLQQKIIEISLDVRIKSK